MTTTNMSLNEPSVGVTTGPDWATQVNENFETIDTHDHTSGKGVQLTPSALNINADLEFNQNSATELKNVIFDSSVTAATTSYSVYQSGGNLYWRNGSGTAVQITSGSGINTSGGSISGMTGNAQVQFSNVNNSYTFKFDSTLTDGIAKVVVSDLQLYFYNSGSATTRSVNLKYTGSGTGSNTLTVPDETGTLLSTATSFAGTINIATSSSNAPINLKPNGTGSVVVGNGGATGKLTSNGAYDLILDTNGGTNSSSIAITDAANGNISLIPNGTGEIVIGSGSASGKITTNSTQDLVLDTNAGTNSGSITIEDGVNGDITISTNGTGTVDIARVDIDGGSVDGVTIGTNDVVTDLRVDNLKMDSNTLSSTNTNGDINLTPDGTGDVVASNASNASTIKTTGAGGVSAETAFVDLGASSASDGNVMARIKGIRGGGTGDTEGHIAFSVKSAANTITERLRISASGSITTPNSTEFNGTIGSSATMTGKRLLAITTITATGAYTHTLNSNTTHVICWVQGAGGGGGGGDSATRNGSGGGGGAFCIGSLDVVYATDSTLTGSVGAKGTAGGSSTGTGGTGGSTTVTWNTSNTITSAGGIGGYRGGGSPASGGAGGAVTISGFTSILSQTGGAGIFTKNGSYTYGGSEGGNSFLGFGGSGASTNIGPQAGNGYGSGGGGGSGTGSSLYGGATGADGIIIIYEYI
jgi:hypothetical protein